MGRPKDRRSAAGLLPRMEAHPLKNGGASYRYHPIGGKPIQLGRDKQEALRRVLEMNGTPKDPVGTLRWIWERYTDEQRPAPRWKKLSDGTKADYRGAWKQIEAVFGDSLASAITPVLVAKYVHQERSNAPRRANIEKALMSNLFKYGITLGVCQANPTIGVEPHESEARTEAPQEMVLARFLEWLGKQTPQRRIIGMAAEFASLAGNRQVEFLPLTWPQVDTAAGVIRTIRAKQRGKKREQIIEVISISPAMSELLSRLESIRYDRECLYVFPTRDRNQYTARGFKTLWNRCVHAAMKDGALKADDRFTFHDLRAFYVTKHKQTTGRLPDMHKNQATTASVYDRTKEVPRSAN